MSIIPAGAGAGTGASTLTELPALLKRWMMLQEEITTLNNDIKQRRTQSKALKEVILRIMSTNKVAALNVSKGTVMHKVRETSETMTDTYLLKHAKEFFGGDEERAKALVEYLEAQRATRVTHDLKIAIAKGGVADDAMSRRS
jgi:hypothetical protein